MEQAVGQHRHMFDNYTAAPVPHKKLPRAPHHARRRISWFSRTHLRRRPQRIPAAKSGQLWPRSLGNGLCGTCAHMGHVGSSKGKHIVNRRHRDNSTMSGDKFYSNQGTEGESGTNLKCPSPLMSTYIYCTYGALKQSSAPSCFKVD